MRVSALSGGRRAGYCTQLLLAVAASQVFANIPKFVSVVRELSANIGGVQALSVTQAVQLAPFPGRLAKRGLEGRVYRFVESTVDAEPQILAELCEVATLLCRGLGHGGP